MSEIANAMHELESEKSKFEGDPDKLEVVFREMIQISLWFVCILVSVRRFDMMFDIGGMPQ